MDPGILEELEHLLKALANLNRLQLLVALQDPRRLGELSLAPSRGGKWGTEERSISRQGVRKHLQELEGLGVVSAVPMGDGEPRWVVNHAKLFEVTERLRELATVRARMEVQKETLALDAPAGPARAAGPQLVLVRGVHEGQVWPLGAPRAEGWLVGRAKEAEVRLDYDPYVSSAHARVVPAAEGRHALVDMPGNRNGTLLNWQPLARGAVAPLEPGDVVGVGMSLLLYRR